MRKTKHSNRYYVNARALLQFDGGIIKVAREKDVLKKL